MSAPEFAGGFDLNSGYSQIEPVTRLNGETLFEALTDKMSTEAWCW